MSKYCPYCCSQIVSDHCPNCTHASTYHAKPHHLSPGTLLRGKYLVGVVLGEGGFGITYLGRDLALDMKVAIKEYYPSGMVTRSGLSTEMISLVSHTYSQDFSTGKNQVLLEAQALAKLDKEGAVVTVRDFFKENNTAYIVMEYVEGNDLREIIRQQDHPIAPNDLMLLEPVFAALGEMHKLGLVHRDISPDNIMIENGVARLIDFGCTQPTRHDGTYSSAVKHSFSPIEQYSNENMGPWTDVYSMAATIYYCITGKLPPKATDRVQKDTLQPPSALGVRLKPRQERAIMRALSVHPSDRFQTMEEFGKQLFVHRNLSKIITAAACAVAVAAVIAILVIPRGTNVTMTSVNRIYQTYTLSSTDISSEDKQTLTKLTDMLKKDAEIQVSDSNFSLKLENKTGRNLEDARLYGRMLDSDGTLLGSTTIYITDWDAGATVKEILYCNDMASVAEIQLKVGYIHDEKTFETNYETSPYAPEEVKKDITIEILNQLPQELSCADYGDTSCHYSIISITPDLMGYSKELRVSGEHLRGDTLSYPRLNYKLTTASGSVVDTGTVQLPKTKAGETFEGVRISFYDLAPGEYKFELSSYSYS